MWIELFDIAMHHMLWCMFLLFAVLFLVVAIPGWRYVSAYTKIVPEKKHECGHCTWAFFALMIAIALHVIIWNTFDLGYLPWNDSPMWHFSTTCATSN